MKKLVIRVTALSFLLAAGTAVMISKVLKPAAKTPQEKDTIQ